MRTISVTAEHIGSGKPLDCNLCPVANALFAATGKEWVVMRHTCTYRYGSLVLALPGKVRQFIADFDAGEKVEPIEFELPLKGDVNNVVE